MILSDYDIEQELASGNLVVTPRFGGDVQPASLDIQLGAIAPFGGGDTPSLWLKPNEFALGSTLQWVEIPRGLVASLHGKSSYGREGLAVHITAGHIDPGFRGEITLELKNLSSAPIFLARGMPIAQLVFHRLLTPCRLAYGEKLGSRYQNQTGPTPSRRDL